MSSLCPDFNPMLAVTQKTLAIERLPHHKTLQNMALTNKGLRPTEQLGESGAEKTGENLRKTLPLPLTALLLVFLAPQWARISQNSAKKSFML